MSWTRVARLVAGKDLRIELRSRVVTNQVLPFGAIIMVMFGFALDNTVITTSGEQSDITSLVAPGLIWLATMFSLLVLVQRSFAVEAADGALDAMRAASMDASAIYWGKTLALFVQLALLEALLLVAVVLLYGTEVPADGIVLLVTTWVVATAALAVVGTLYGGLAAGIKGRETLLPLLVLPAVAPVLIGATRAVEAALDINDVSMSDGWLWLSLLAVFAAAFGVGGSLAFGPLIDD